MNCPNCHKEIKINQVVFSNCEQYHTTNLAVSKCCGAPFLVAAKVSFVVTPYTGSKTEDDWGDPINQIHVVS